jgi:hypothetical protein
VEGRETEKEKKEKRGGERERMGREKKEQS